MKKITFLLFALLLTTASVYAGRIGVLGRNTYGQFGTGTTDGTTMNLTSVTQIGSDADWIDVSCGKYHSIALKANGTLWAWGYNNAGQLGDGTTTNQISPVQIGTDTNWKQFDGGEDFTLAIKTDGTLWAWGNNTYGQFGNGSTTASLIPVQIGTDNDWKVVDCGAFHAIALKTDGSLWAWGYNSSGQIGNGTTANQTTPVQIGTDKTWKKISAGGYTSLAIKQDSILWNWGNIYTASSTTPVIVNNNYKFNEISASYAYPINANTKGCFAGIGNNGIGGPKLPFQTGYYFYSVTAKKMVLYIQCLITMYGPFSATCNSCLFQIASSSLAIESGLSKKVYLFATTTEGKLVGLTAPSQYNFSGNEITSTIPWGKPIAGFEHLLVLEQTEQTITFNALPDKAVGDTDFTLSATTNAFVYDPIVFTSSNESVAKCTGINGATIQIIGAGTCTVSAIQAGNGCWKADTATQILNVKNKPVITWATPTDITYGSALSDTQLNASADVDGTFTYAPASGTILSAGDNQKLLVEFTPTDAANYTTAYDTVYINVKKTMPVITWSNPADMTYGTALSATQLNATTVDDIPGEFSYNPAIGTVLNVSDNQELTVIFTATDAGNYEIAKDTVYLNVKSSAVDVINHEADVTLFSIDPNPASHQFHMNGLKGSAKITLTDMEGKVYLQKTITNGELISIEKIPAGIYLLTVETAEKITPLKLVKK